MASKIDTVTKRNKLQPSSRTWEKVSKGRYIGFLKGVKQNSWLCRTVVDGTHSYNTFKNSEEWSYEEALKASSEWFEGQVDIMPDAITMTVKDAVDHYQKCLTKEKKNPQLVIENIGRVKRHLSDSLNKTKLNSITKIQIDKFRNGIATGEGDEAIRKSKVTANRVLNILKAILNRAYQDQLVGSNRAWDIVKPFQDVEEARQLFLSEKEVNNYLGSTEGAFKALCRACVLTGNRVGSLSNALVKDLDKLEATLKLRTFKGNGKIKVWDCFLSDAALKFFKEQAKGKLPNAPLLPKDNGEPWGKNGYTRLMNATKIKAKMPADFDMYAFRHYYISKALLAGIQAQVIAENCGTSVRMIEKHYGKFLGSDRRAMMNAVELGIEG
jgi:site-specific recombinase XerD